MTDRAAGTPSDIQAIADESFAVLGTGRQISPFSSRFPAFDLAEAYQTAAAVRAMREARGETPLGRKIGFTNRTIWEEYGVSAPMWGYMYDTTVHDLAEAGDGFPLAGLAEPRIEPEIVFGFAAAPDPAMDEAAILGCVEWLAHGFELVQSIFPDWKSQLPDTVAAYGLHGALLIGPRHAVAPERERWLNSLATFEIALSRDGEEVDRGRSANVLGGPLSALKHLVAVLAVDSSNPPLGAGEIVTTGTLTRAFRIAPGQRCRTEQSGIALDGIAIRLA
jgi:2-oxo-3-hexenedioate decarboxylase